MQITIPSSGYELESLNNESKRIIEEGYISEVDYPFKNQPIFSTPGSNIEVCRPEALITFTRVESIRKFLHFNAGTIYEKFKLSSNPVEDILSLDKYFFLRTDIAKRTALKANELDSFTTSIWK